MARENLKKILEGNISFEDYGDNMPNTIPNVFKTFMDEYFTEYEYKRQGKSMPKVISEWLRGLPSTIDMPFYTNEIVHLMYAVGYETKEMEPIDVDNLYWSELGEIIYQYK